MKTMFIVLIVVFALVVSSSLFYLVYTIRKKPGTKPDPDPDPNPDPDPDPDPIPDPNLYICNSDTQCVIDTLGRGTDLETCRKNCKKKCGDDCTTNLQCPSDCSFCNGKCIPMPRDVEIVVNLPQYLDKGSKSFKSGCCKTNYTKDGVCANCENDNDCSFGSEKCVDGACTDKNGRCFASSSLSERVGNIDPEITKKCTDQMSKKLTEILKCEDIKGIDK